MIQKVGQIGVPVKVLDRAIQFYKDKLGLSLLFNTDSMAFFECNGLRLLLSLPEKDEFAYSSSVVYFQVENIKAIYETLVGNGVLLLMNHISLQKWDKLKHGCRFLKTQKGILML